jgi:hypothetical protein
MLSVSDGESETEMFQRLRNRLLETNIGWRVMTWNW